MIDELEYEFDDTEIADRQAAEREHKMQRTNELNDIRTILATKAGRNFLNRFLEYSGFFKMSMRPDNRDMTVFHEGQRDTGHWLMNELRQSIENRDDDGKNFDKLMKEYWRK